jgi:hypothetical protein
MRMQSKEKRGRKDKVGEIGIDQIMHNLDGKSSIFKQAVNII